MSLTQRMKAKCPECGTGKARRLCRRRENVEICSECCATIRDAECEGCAHYASVRKYEENRQLSAAGISDGHILKEISPEVEVAVNEALEAAQRGGLEGAMNKLNDLMRDHPLHHGIPFGIGVIHVIKREYAESITWFDRAIKIWPYSLEAHYNKAVSYRKLYDLPNCIRAYQKVIEIGPPEEPEVEKARTFIEEMNSTIRESQGVSLRDYLRAADEFNRAHERMERGEWSRALKGFRTSAALNERNAPCHGNMGICLAYLGRKAEALAELDRAMELDPGYEPAISNRKLFEKMSEGKPLENARYESINFGLEKLRNQRLE